MGIIPTYGDLEVVFVYNEKIRFILKNVDNPHAWGLVCLQTKSSTSCVVPPGGYPECIEKWRHENRLDFGDK